MNHPLFQNELPASTPSDNGCPRVKHFANPGDAIAVLGALKKYYDVTERKVIFCQQVNQLAQYYPGAVHPTVNEAGQNVCVNNAIFDMLAPLIASQHYIHSVERYEGQRVDMDFDVIRGKTFVNLPHGMIQAWVVFAFPDLAFDISKPWVSLPDDYHPVQEQTRGKVIINFTERYRNSMMDYFYLKGFAPDLVFAGTEREHFLFCNQWQLTIPRLEIKDFLEYAYAIKASKFFLGNQSFGWNLAEAMKHPRVLELCQYAANCQPMIGEDSYGYYHQIANEYYFRTLYNKTKSPR
jgi:hypothetical protein